jgi:hypothetical protein
MALFDSVPRDMHNEIVADLKAQRDRIQTMYEALVKQALEIKRHEHGMNSADFDPATLDPTHGLGSRTLAAIEEFSGGDAELRRYLVAHAWSLWTQHNDKEPGDRDETVAAIILAGDRE